MDSSLRFVAVSFYLVNNSSPGSCGRQDNRVLADGQGDVHAHVGDVSP